MSLGTAVCFVLVGGTVLMQVQRRRPRWTTAASLVALASTLTLPPLTALGLALGCLSLLCLGQATVSRRLGVIGGSLAVVVATGGALITVGYLFGAPVLYGIPGRQTSLGAGLSMVFLGPALLGLAPPDAPPLRQFVGSSARARLLRSMLPIVPVIILVQLVAERIGGHQGAHGAVTSVLTAAVVTGLLSFSARGVGRKLDRAEQDRADQRFEAIFHSPLMAIGIAERDTGRLVEVNECHAKFFGYAPEEMIGRTVSDLGLWVDPGDRERLLAAITPEHPTARGEVRFRRRSGEIRDAMVALETMTLPGISGLVTLVAIVDVTERQATEAALRESERRFSSMLARLNLLSLMLDTRGRVTYGNDYLLRLIGWSREEVLGQDWFELCVPPDAPGARAAFKNLLDDAPQTWHHQNEILTRSGERRMIRWNNSVLLSPEGTVVGTASIGEDVTEHLRTGEQLQQSQKMEAVGRLAGGVAHDFNNSLGVILGYTELLLRHAVPAQRGKLEQILRATNRASGLTRSLLAFSRKQVVDPKVLDLNHLVADLQTMLRRLIGEDVDVAIVPGADLGQVKVDPGQVEQVLMNLCVNARDAMPEGGLLRIETANVVLRAEDSARHDAVPPGPYVKLAVSDTGTGIAHDIIDTIFEPFFTTKEPGKGTGLGLSMAYGIVKQAGGGIWVESEVGRGTTFAIYLPRIDEPLTISPASVEANQLERGCETILLVEDEAGLRSITRELLEEQGYHVVEAAGGNEAVAVAGSFPGTLHLLLTDVVMPGMNGRVLAAALHGTRPDLAVLYMSGYTDDVIVRHGVLEHGSALLEKPFTAAGLLGSVRDALGRRRAEELA